MMDQSYSISIEGLDHVVRQWSNKFSKVGHLVFSLGQWCTIVAYQIPWYNSFKLLIPWSHFSVAQASQTFKYLNMCTPTYTTSNFITDKCNCFQQLLKWTDDLYSTSLLFYIHTSMPRSCLLMIMTTVSYKYCKTIEGHIHQ